jgi:hypothetical protein
MAKPLDNQSDDTFDETVIPPRFDQGAVRGARRVVPITDETDEVTRTAALSQSWLRDSSPITFSKPSWTLALVITLALFVVAAGSVAVHRRASGPSPNHEGVSATASTVIDVESTGETKSRRRSESNGRSRAGAENGDDRNGYYAGQRIFIEGPDEGRGKDNRGEGRGEGERRDKDEKWKDREKEREKEGRGRGGDEYRKRFEKAEKDFRRIREMFKGGKD